MLDPESTLKYCCAVTGEHGCQDCPDPRRDSWEGTSEPLKCPPEKSNCLCEATSHNRSFILTTWFTGRAPGLTEGLETKLSLQVVHHASVTDPQ